ncbi:hypothetical protein LWT70_24435, partial [Enterobacter hormaechei]|nr:hypothetical protein [Enterobacter hormaechei]
DKEVNVGLLPTRIAKDRDIRPQFLITFIPVIFQVASLLAALTHPGHIVIYAPGVRSLAVAMHLEIHRVYTSNMGGKIISITINGFGCHGIP